MRNWRLQCEKRSHILFSFLPLPLSLSLSLSSSKIPRYVSFLSFRFLSGKTKIYSAYGKCRNVNCTVAPTCN